jgi:hypothetical protein
VAERICRIKKDRLEHKYLFGSEYVQMDYCKLYPKEEKPSLLAYRPGRSPSWTPKPEAQDTASWWIGLPVVSD